MVVLSERALCMAHTCMSVASQSGGLSQEPPGRDLCLLSVERAAAITQAVARTRDGALTGTASSLTGMGGTLTADEVAVMSGALELTMKTASVAMTPMSKVINSQNKTNRQGCAPLYCQPHTGIDTHGIWWLLGLVAGGSLGTPLQAPHRCPSQYAMQAPLHCPSCHAIKSGVGPNPPCPPKVFAISENAALDDTLVDDILASGYSRIPVTRCA
jgi:hypothetical protein